MIDRNRETILEHLRDTAGLTAALKRAARNAVEEHARAGRKIVVWRDGQVAWEDASTGDMVPAGTSGDN